MSHLTDWVVSCASGVRGWLSGWLAGWLISLLINYLNDSLTGWSSEWLDVWLADWWLVVWLDEWQVSFVSRVSRGGWSLAYWLSSRAVDWWNGWLIGRWLGGLDWLIGEISCLAGQVLNGWCACWQASWWLSVFLAVWLADFFGLTRWLGVWLTTCLNLLVGWSVPCLAGVGDQHIPQQRITTNSLERRERWRESLSLSSLTCPLNFSQNFLGLCMRLLVLEFFQVFPNLDNPK